tara:strand:- start:54 stop:179 length:126 start_codon:yes stop_codon:yes gene_type:complete
LSVFRFAAISPTLASATSSNPAIGAEFLGAPSLISVFVSPP